MAEQEVRRFQVRHQEQTVGSMHLNEGICVSSAGAIWQPDWKHNQAVILALLDKGWLARLAVYDQCIMLWDCSCLQGG